MSNTLYNGDDQIPSWATVEGDEEDRENYSNSHSFYDQVKLHYTITAATLSLTFLLLV